RPGLFIFPGKYIRQTRFPASHTVPDGNAGRHEPRDGHGGGHRLYVLLERTGDFEEGAMILIFGSHGYMGSAIVAECERRGIRYKTASYNSTHNYWENETGEKFELVINATALIPNPTVDECKNNQEATIYSNVCLPYLWSIVTAIKDIPIMH